MPDNVWPTPRSPASAPYVGGLYDGLDDIGLRLLRGDRPLPEASAPLLRRAGQARQFDPAPAALSAGSGRRRRACAPARTRTSTSSPCCSAPRRRGWRCSTATAAGCRSMRRRARVVCNIGDMLQRLTNHVLPSTTHRVVNPPPERRGVSRYSTPFFLHFEPDYVIRTLPSCVVAGQSGPLSRAYHRPRLPDGAAEGDQADVVRGKQTGGCLLE